MKTNNGLRPLGHTHLAWLAGLLLGTAIPVATGAQESGNPLKNMVDQLDEAQRARVVSIVQSAGTNIQARQIAMLEILLSLNPDLVKALRALNAERPAEALPILDRLAASSDPFLAKHAAWFRIQVLAAQERYEDALTALPSVQTNAAQYTQLADEMLYIQGLLQARLLDRAGAAATLRRYLEQYPELPPERRAAAQGVLAEIENVDTNSLPEAATLMNESRRRLGLSDSGDTTQTRQRQIVLVLGQIIKELEEKQKQQGGGGGGGGGGSSSSSSSSGAQGGASGGRGAGAKESSLAGGAEGTQLGKASDAGDPDAWAKAYAREREKVQRELQTRLPERYRDLIEQYYRSLSSEAKPEAETSP